MEKVADIAEESLEEEFERLAYEDDGSAADEILAAGMPIHVVQDDTPGGHVTRIYPDGREEHVQVDWDEAARILGR